MSQHQTNIVSLSPLFAEYFLIIHAIPANTRCWPNVGLKLAHRLRRWPNISPTLGQRLVVAGMSYQYDGMFTVGYNRCVVHFLIYKPTHTYLSSRALTVPCHVPVPVGVCSQAAGSLVGRSGFPPQAILKRGYDFIGFHWSTIVRFTLNSSTRINEFRRFLSQFSINFNEILHTLFSIHVVTTLKNFAKFW